MSAEEKGRTQHEINWKKAHVPPGATRMHYVCHECGHRIVLSPRAHTRVLPSIYCTECEHGPPYGVVAIEFHDGYEIHPGREELVSEELLAELQGDDGEE